MSNISPESYHSQPNAINQRDIKHTKGFESEKAITKNMGFIDKIVFYAKKARGDFSHQNGIYVSKKRIANAFLHENIPNITSQTLTDNVKNFLKFAQSNKTTAPQLKSLARKLNDDDIHQLLTLHKANEQLTTAFIKKSREDIECATSDAANATFHAYLQKAKETGIKVDEYKAKISTYVQGSTFLVSQLVTDITSENFVKWPNIQNVNHPKANAQEVDTKENQPQDTIQKDVTQSNILFKFRLFLQINPINPQLIASHLSKNVRDFLETAEKLHTAPNSAPYNKKLNQISNKLTRSELKQLDQLYQEQKQSSKDFIPSKETVTHITNHSSNKEANNAFYTVLRHMEEMGFSTQTAQKRIHLYVKDTFLKTGQLERDIIFEAINQTPPHQDFLKKVLIASKLEEIWSIASPKEQGRLLSMLAPQPTDDYAPSLQTHHFWSLLSSAEPATIESYLRHNTLPPLSSLQESHIGQSDKRDKWQDVVAATFDKSPELIKKLPQDMKRESKFISKLVQIAQEKQNTSLLNELFLQNILYFDEEGKLLCSASTDDPHDQSIQIALTNLRQDEKLREYIENRNPVFVFEESTTQSGESLYVSLIEPPSLVPEEIYEDIMLGIIEAEETEDKVKNLYGNQRENAAQVAINIHKALTSSRQIPDELQIHCGDYTPSEGNLQEHHLATNQIQHLSRTTLAYLLIYDAMNRSSQKSDNKAFLDTISLDAIDNRILQISQNAAQKQWLIDELRAGVRANHPGITGDPSESEKVLIELNRIKQFVDQI